MRPDDKKKTMRQEDWRIGFLRGAGNYSSQLGLAISAWYSSALVASM